MNRELYGISKTNLAVHQGKPKMPITRRYYYHKISFLLQLFTLSFATFATEHLMATPEISLSGDLPRDSSIGFFDLTVVIKNVATADGQAAIGDSNQANEVMKKRLKITFSGIQGSQGIRYDDTKVDDKLYLIPQGGKAETDANGTQKISFIVRVTQLADKLSVTAASGELKSVAYFYKDDGSTELSKSAETSIKRNDAAPNGAPENFSVLSSNRKLAAGWTNPATIPYTKNGDKAPPSQVMMFWVEQTTDPITLDAFEFKEDNKDIATTCSLNTNAATGTECVSCNGANIYLSQNQSDTRVRYRTFNDTSGTTTADLNLEKKYAVFLMYAPFAIKRSACIVEIPTLNYTLTELNGEGEASQVDLRCFIATAAFGSPLHRHLEGFRWLRDRFLMQHALGRKFVSTYYRLAPPVAEVIAVHPWLQRVTRTLLYPFAFTLEGAMGLAHSN